MILGQTLKELLTSDSLAGMELIVTKEERDEFAKLNKYTTSIEMVEDLKDLELDEAQQIMTRLLDKFHTPGYESRVLKFCEIRRKLQALPPVAYVDVDLL